MSRALVIDPHPDEREATRRLLEAEGYEVHGFENATEGYAALAQVRPDVVFVELYMPDVDGLEFLEAVAKRHASFAVVVTSSPERVSFHAISAIAIHLGARRVMPKPIGLARLRSVLRQILAA